MEHAFGTNPDARVEGVRFMRDLQKAFLLEPESYDGEQDDWATATPLQGLWTGRVRQVLKQEDTFAKIRV